jgi:hypothetical protein
MGNRPQVVYRLMQNVARSEDRKIEEEDRKVGKSGCLFTTKQPPAWNDSKSFIFRP